MQATEQSLLKDVVPDPPCSIRAITTHEAASWREATTIRDYAAQLKVTAAADGGPIAPALAAWLVWADTVADKLDPSSKRLIDLVK